MEKSAALKKDAMLPPYQRDISISKPAANERGATGKIPTQMVQKVGCKGCESSRGSLAQEITSLLGAQRRDAVIYLQRTKGNQFVQRLAIQAKLNVGPAGDKYEQEADQVANRVMRLIEAKDSKPIRRQEDEDIQTKPVGIVRPKSQTRDPHYGFEAGVEFESQLNRSRGGGSPLPEGLRGQMEQGFGADFRGVRVHTGSESAQLNRAVSAQAFTLGHDIYLGEGKSDITSNGGQKLLAHELTHVVQQTGSHTESTASLAVKRRTESEQIQGLWDLAAPNWATANEIEPLDPRGTVFLVTDNAHDRMILKLSDTPPILAGLAGALYGVGGMPVVQAHDVTNNLAQVQALINTRTKWGNLTKWMEIATHMNFVPPPGTPLLGRRDWQLNQTKNFVLGSLCHPPRSWLEVQSVAPGRDTSKIAEQRQARTLFENENYCIQVGTLAALDTFLMNGDRVLGGNLGNWFSDAATHSVSALIDNADQTARSYWAGNGAPIFLSDGTLADIHRLAPGETTRYAFTLMMQLADDLRRYGEFHDNQEKDNWLLASTGPGPITHRALMVRGLTTGLNMGRQLLQNHLGPGHVTPQGAAVHASVAVDAGYMARLNARIAQLMALH